MQMWKQNSDKQKKTNKFFKKVLSKERRKSSDNIEEHDEAKIKQKSNSAELEAQQLDYSQQKPNTPVPRGSNDLQGQNSSKITKNTFKNGKQRQREVDQDNQKDTQNKGQRKSIEQPNGFTKDVNQPSDTSQSLLQTKNSSFEGSTNDDIDIFLNMQKEPSNLTSQYAQDRTQDILNNQEQIDTLQLLQSNNTVKSRDPKHSQNFLNTTNQSSQNLNTATQSQELNKTNTQSTTDFEIKPNADFMPSPKKPPLRKNQKELDPPPPSLITGINTQNPTHSQIQLQREVIAQRKNLDEISEIQEIQEKSIQDIDKEIYEGDASQYQNFMSMQEIIQNIPSVSRANTNRDDRTDVRRNSLLKEDDQKYIQEIKSMEFNEFPIFVAIEGFDAKVSKNKVVDKINECYSDSIELEPIKPKQATIVRLSSKATIVVVEIPQRPIINHLVERYKKQLTVLNVRTVLVRQNLPEEQLNQEGGPAEYLKNIIQDESPETNNHIQWFECAVEEKESKETKKQICRFLLLINSVPNAHILYQKLNGLQLDEGTLEVHYVDQETQDRLINHMDTFLDDAKAREEKNNKKREKLIRQQQLQKQKMEQLQKIQKLKQDQLVKEQRRISEKQQRQIQQLRAEQEKLISQSRLGTPQKLTQKPIQIPSSDEESPPQTPGLNTLDTGNQSIPVPRISNQVQGDYSPYKQSPPQYKQSPPQQLSAPLRQPRISSNNQRYSQPVASPMAQPQANNYSNRNKVDDFDATSNPEYIDMQDKLAFYAQQVNELTKFKAPKATGQGHSWNNRTSAFAQHAPNGGPQGQFQYKAGYQPNQSNNQQQRQPYLPNYVFSNPIMQYNQQKQMSGPVGGGPNNNFYGTYQRMQTSPYPYDTPSQRQMSSRMSSYLRESHNLYKSQQPGQYTQVPSQRNTGMLTQSYSGPVYPQQSMFQQQANNYGQAQYKPQYSMQYNQYQQPQMQFQRQYSQPQYQRQYSGGIQPSYSQNNMYSNQFPTQYASVQAQQNGSGYVQQQPYGYNGQGYMQQNQGYGNDMYNGMQDGMNNGGYSNGQNRLTQNVLRQYQKMQANQGVYP